MESGNEVAVGKRSLRQRQHKEAEEQATSYDNMLCVDQHGETGTKRKLFCPECGLPRNPELALRVPCGACGAMGTQKQAPQFDDLGERIPDEVIAARRAEALRLLQAGRAAAREAAKIAVQLGKLSTAVKFTQVARKDTTQDLFLSIME